MYCLILLAGVSGACGSRDFVAERPGDTIQWLMAEHVDPAADALWDSVATIVSSTGMHERRPRTAAEWQAVRAQALALIKAAEMVGAPGRRVSDKSVAPGRGELPASEIQRRIDANHEAFAGLASALRATAQQALAAIDSRDPQRLMDAGGAIDSACEACHLQYWYPVQAAGPAVKP